MVDVARTGAVEINRASFERLVFPKVSVLAIQLKEPQIPSLTGLRFIAAMAVVLSHSIPKIVKYEQPPEMVVLLSQTAAEGMTLFFVLSGFVIFLNYSGSIGTRIGLWNFLIARFARLYPLYFLCVAFDLTMKFSYNQFPVDRVGSLPFYITLTQSWLYFPISGHSLVYQFGLMPQVSWSISTEWFFYFAFPLIAAALWPLRSTKMKIVTAMVFSAIVLTCLTLLNFKHANIVNFGIRQYGQIAADPQDSYFRWLMYFSPYTRIAEFVLGCFCASIFAGLAPPSPRENRFGAWLTAGALAGMVALHWVMFGIQDKEEWHVLIHQLHQNFGFAPFLAILIFCCARYRNGFARLMSSSWIVLGGEASYSIYLLHELLINAFRYEAATITSWNVALGSYLQLLVVLAATVGLSLITWRFIEVPFRFALRTLQVDKSRQCCGAAACSNPATR